MVQNTAGQFGDRRTTDAAMAAGAAVSASGKLPKRRSGWINIGVRQEKI